MLTITHFVSLLERINRVGKQQKMTPLNINTQNLSYGPHKYLNLPSLTPTESCNLPIGIWLNYFPKEIYLENISLYN